METQHQFSMSNALVMKFGGTSLGSAQRISEVANIVRNRKNTIVVCSAMAGTTNALVEINEYLYRKNKEGALEKIEQLHEKYTSEVNVLFGNSTKEVLDEVLEMVKAHFDYVRTFTRKMFTSYEERAILAQGELISSALLHRHLQESGTPTHFLQALNFVRLDQEQEPDQGLIQQQLKEEIELVRAEAREESSLFVTQGYICRNSFGEVDNLKRGGSDYSASLIGAAIGADEIQIWTDIDGMHNNDPRVVPNTRPLSRLSFDEAAELAYFGAKILHPYSVLPAKLSGIPVRLKNTLQPEAEGTLISNQTEETEIKAIAAKDGITAIKIKSGRMLLAYGFLRKVFEIFESYKTPIDMITTSEVAVSVTVDQQEYLGEIEQELRQFGTVDIDSELSIICIVGNFIAESKGIAVRIFDALKEIPIRMISYGGSKHNVSILVRTEDKEKALLELNEKLF